MEKALKTAGWTVLNFEGIPIAEGLPSWQSAVAEILTDDGHDYEIRMEEGGGWRLWVTDRSRNAADGCRMVESVFFSAKTDEEAATDEILADVREQAARDWGNHGRDHFRVLTDADRAAELAEDEDGQPGVVRLDGEGIYFNEAASFMDDDLREELHQKLAPCADQVFMDAYAKAHLKKFGEAFQV